MRWLRRFWQPIVDPLAYVMAERPLSGEALIPESAAWIRRLALQRRRQRHLQAQAGQHSSVFKGQGLDFAELREYWPGDDIRKLDWQVFARTLVPHIRDYHEERQLTIWIALDLGPSAWTGSGLYGLTNPTGAGEPVPVSGKIQRMLEYAAVLSLLAQEAQAKLGWLVTDRRQTQVLSPKTGMPSVHRGLQTAAALVARQAIDDDDQQPPPVAFSQVTADLRRVVGKQTLVFVISDFWEADVPQWLSPLGEMTRKNHGFFLVVRDALESRFPTGLGLAALRDPLAQTVCWVDSDDPKACRHVDALLADAGRASVARLSALGKTVRAEAGQSSFEVLMRLLSGGGPRG